ncbi:MAG: hypothetical protein KBT48_02695 [Firmicutes bacterium]|nr:hypothetical protein [Bacillota bacterium]
MEYIREMQKKSAEEIRNEIHKLREQIYHYKNDRCYPKGNCVSAKSIRNLIEINEEYISALEDILQEREEALV